MRASSSSTSPINAVAPISLKASRAASNCSRASEDRRALAACGHTRCRPDSPPAASRGRRAAGPPRRNAARPTPDLRSRWRPQLGHLEGRSRERVLHAGAARSEFRELGSILEPAQFDQRLGQQLDLRHEEAVLRRARWEAPRESALRPQPDRAGQARLTDAMRFWIWKTSPVRLSPPRVSWPRTWLPRRHLVVAVNASGVVAHCLVTVLQLGGERCRARELGLRRWSWPVLKVVHPQSPRRGAASPRFLAARMHAPARPAPQ